MFFWLILLFTISSRMSRKKNNENNSTIPNIPDDTTTSPVDNYFSEPSTSVEPTKIRLT